MNGFHSIDEPKHDPLYKQTDLNKLNETQLFKFQNLIEQKFNLNFSK